MDEKRKPKDLGNAKSNIGPFTDQELDRRSFLQKAAGTLAGAGLISAFPFIKTTHKSREDLFTLGVASGDPLSDSVVLWTRLAPQPFKVGGGMSFESVEVYWELAKDQSFKHIIKNGTVVARSLYAHSVHVEVDGLEPDHWYYYRFKAEGQTSPTGRTKTFPARGAEPKEMNFAFASCHRYPEGYYTAYDYMVKENIEVVFFLGDYIYEGPMQKNIGRGHIPEKEVRSLEEYRIRYAQYKSDPSLKAAHAAFPWIATIDDHEIKGNWGGEGPPYGHSENDDFLVRRSNALQAYYEHLPWRKMSIPDGINMRLYRKFSYGNLAEFNVLDTRQYRTDFACGPGGDVDTIQTKCKERFKDSRTIMGWKQERWLFNNLTRSSTRWNIIPQGIMMAQRDRKKGPVVALSMDDWNGYVASRNRLFKTIKQHDISNVIVLTGDAHKNYVNNLKEDFNDPDSLTLGTEFVGTSISSAGDGSDMTQRGKVYLEENPWLKFFNAQRGYVRCKITQEEMEADFRVLPYVTKPGASIATRATFKVKNERPGAIQL